MAGNHGETQTGVFPFPRRFCSCLLKTRGPFSGERRSCRGAETPSSPLHRPPPPPPPQHGSVSPFPSCGMSVHGNGPGVQVGKEALRAGGRFKMLTITDRESLVLGVLSCPQLSVLPLFLFWCLLFLPPAARRTCLFLACTPGRQGRRHVPLSDSAALSPASPEHSPCHPQSGRLSMAPAESLAQRLVGQQTGAACRCLHGAGGSCQLDLAPSLRAVTLVTAGAGPCRGGRVGAGHASGEQQAGRSRAG